MKALSDHASDLEAIADDLTRQAEMARLAAKHLRSTNGASPTTQPSGSSSGRTGRPVGSGVMQQRILAILRESPRGLTTGEIAKRDKGNKSGNWSNANAALQRLEQAGLAERDSDKAWHIV